MMTIKELEDILRANNICKYDYSLSEDNPPLIETVVCLRKLDDKYKYFVSDHGEIIEENYFDSENNACQYLLKEMAYGYEELKKYIK